MKKKALVILLFIITLSISVLSFTACDKKVTVTVYRQNSAYAANDKPFKITKHSGETVTFAEFKELYIDNEIPIPGPGPELGFYLDKECTIKYDEDTPIKKNLTLYTDSHYTFGPESSYTIINFVYKNKKYPMFKSMNSKLTATDFTISAYGKPIDANSLEFYFDEEMTIKLDLTDLEVSSLFTEGEFHYKKSIYVKNTAE